MNYKHVYAQQVKAWAEALGFEHCGIAKAEKLHDDARRLEHWLNQGYHGRMGYMENHFEQRVDPRRLVEGAKTVITLVLNYYPEIQPWAGPLKIARYAYGEDYHDVIRAKLRTLLMQMNDDWGDVQGRGFVDSAPVLERAWAVKSGLGWVGKNGNLILKGQGSYFFIATLIIDRELEPDLPFITDHCGSCRRCIDACPTEAILPDKSIQANRCISYYTIELKDNPFNQVPHWQDWVFGCDVCQEVCPWNRFSTPHQINEFSVKREVTGLTQSDWKTLRHDTFLALFKYSPLKRAGYTRLMRNINHVISTETT